MANVGTYLDWRADVSFAGAPFNEVDNAILSLLAYTEFEGVVPGVGGKKLSIEAVTKQFFQMHTTEELMKSESTNKEAPFLLKKMAGSGRFGGTKIGDYVAVVDNETQTQFSAITYYLPDDSVYIAYRGTDTTLIGWKEDMNMCFMPEMPGHRKAIDYLERIMSRVPEDKTIYVGGHSKGGHFALYASTFCKKKFQDRIKVVYSNDGPGLMKAQVASEAYKNIYKRVVHIIPDTSIFGVLMEHRSKPTIIQTASTGVDAHNIFDWQVLGNKFERSDGQKDSSIVLDKVIKKWMGSVEPESRKLFWEAIYAGMEAGGETLGDLLANPVKAAALIIKSVESLPEENKLQFRKVMKMGGASGTENIKEFLEAKFSKEGLAHRHEEKEEEKIEKKKAKKNAKLTPKQVHV